MARVRGYEGRMNPGRKMPGRQRGGVAGPSEGQRGRSGRTKMAKRRGQQNAMRRMGGMGY